MTELTHMDDRGRPRMVDVGEKAASLRVAIAESFVRISPALEACIRANDIAKGNLLEVAKLAGVQGAKRTDELVPLCHTVPLDVVDVQATLEAGRVHLRAEVRTHWKTGVEMEALTAVCIAALTVIDMGKAVDKGMIIEGVRVLEKRGGRSGDYNADGKSP
jgi:cyclic pyranopterin monophosphate synthase